jgi:hypothetical protein
MCARQVHATDIYRTGEYKTSSKASARASDSKTKHLNADDFPVPDGPTSIIP